jgi:histone H3/H4
MSDEVLVVVSKLKKYIKDCADMNTAGSVADALSTAIRRMCDKAIQNAKSDGRKTVMDRDFE